MSLEVQHVSKTFGSYQALRDVSLKIEEGELVTLLGPSGSGKTTTCLSLLRLLPRGAQISGGSVELDGVDILKLPETEMQRVRGKRIAMILQDPMASLNPLLTIDDQVSEPAYFHRGQRGHTLREHVIALLRAVRIPSPAILNGTCLRLRMMSVASSTTPGMGLNS